MALNYPAQPGDIDHLIADDHTVVDRLFQHLEAGRGDRRVLTDQIIVELSTHTVAEEVVMYPLWRTLGMDEFDDDARQEHGDMKELLATLSKTDPGEDEFEKALSELIEVTRHHVEDEEQEEMPAFRDKVGADKLAELGKQVLAAKRQAPPAPHPHAPDEGMIERAVGALAKPVDAAKAAVTGKNKHLATDASGLLDPQAQALVDAYSELTPRPSEILEPAEARKQPALGDGLKKVMRDRGIEYPEPVDSVKDVQIPDGAGGEQTLRVFTPASAAEGTQPIILWIHGGGWVLFDEDSYDSSCRGLANKTGAIVVSPHYRLAPEYVFPAAHDDVLTAWRWTAANAAQLGGGPSRMAIGGESAGGTMAAATTLQLVQAGEPLPAAQVCAYPLTTAEPHGESMTSEADGRPLRLPLLSWMAMYAFEGVPEAATDPRIDLLNWPRESLASMPPTLVITCERDILRDQGQEFAANLEAAGVPTTSSHYQGVMHEFFGAAPVLDKAEQAQRETAEHFGAAVAPGR